MTKPLRVLLAGAVLGQPAGGVRRHNAELLPILARKLADSGGCLDVLAGMGKVAFDLPPEARVFESEVPAGPPILRAVTEGRAIRHRLFEAQEAGETYDLVHTAHFPVPRQLGTPLVVTVHDLRALSLEHTPLSRRLIAGRVYGQALRHAAGVIAVSSTVRDELMERFQLPEERVHLVHNAADHFTPLPRRPRADAPLLHLGHLEPRKNLTLLIRALAADPNLPQLVLAGAAKGDEKERLTALAHELGVEKRVHLFGPYDEAELPDLLATCAALVVPSKLEGFGIPVLEAQRASVPVAISRAGALTEVAGREAPSFDPGDADACAAAIRAALQATPEQLATARVRAERWTWKAAAEAWHTAWQASRRLPHDDD